MIRQAFITAVALWLLPAANARAETVFTAVSVAGNKTYVAVKRDQRGEGLTSALFELDSKTTAAHPLKLPADIKEREIRLIFPGSAQLFILTQWTTEQGDNPTVHAYNSKTGAWTKLGELACPSFDEVEVRPDAISITCPEGGQKKTLKAGKSRFPNAGTLKIPQAASVSKDVSARLMGDIFEWTKLQLKSGSGEKSVLASKLSF